MKRRAFVTRSLGLATGVACLALAGMANRLSASTIPGHRVVDLELLDADRGRPVPARLYLPGQASAETPVPLVVFSHGLGGSRSGYQYLGSHWADMGIASLHPQHVGSDSDVWRGNPLELVQRLQAAAQAPEVLARALDLRFVLDQLLASDQGRLIDTASIAAAGHSYGANTVMLVSGARVGTAYPETRSLRDPRIRSAILISAPPIQGQGPAEQVLAPITIPTLHITSTDDTIKIPGYRSTVEDRIAIFAAMSGSPRTLAVFNTGGHSIFTDRTTWSGPEISARIKAATRELSTLFLQQTLRRGPPLPATGREDHPDIERWRLRHQDLLDRFDMPGVAAAR